MARAPDAVGAAQGSRVLLSRGRIALVALILGLGPVRAAERCPALFVDNRPPELTNPKLAAKTLPLCFDAYAVLHSGVARAPLYAAERLTRASVSDARRVERIDAFHDEDRVPADERARLDDYVRSGFDRGHLAPAGDMPTGAAQAQSFSLANVVPQNRALNRSLWAAIEESTRRLATRRGQLFVVTGPVYAGDALSSINGRVLVPSQMFKAIYDPGAGEGGAYLAPNDAGGTWQAISLDALRGVAGIDAFPSLSPSQKASAMTLPEPRAYSRDDVADHRPQGREQTWRAWLGHEAARALHRALRQLLRAIF
ncbi:DNA/RNA non-specific endonuclease [Methylobacterium sp. WL8]|nr:DNA/RNA non-specific endonuclease [Methylobacterium sp. WL8]